LDLSELGRAKKLYKVQVGFRLIAEIKIKQMMDANIIRPSNSPYNQQLANLMEWSAAGSIFFVWILVDDYYLAIYFRFFASSCILGDGFAFCGILKGSISFIPEAGVSCYFLCFYY